MGLLITFAEAIGVPERLRKAFAWLLLAVAAVAIAVLVALAVSSWISSREKAAVVLDRTQANAQASGRVLAADRKAGAAKAERDRRDQADQDQLQEKAHAAASDGASPLDALFDELR